MAFNINDLGYEKDSKERMPWEHYMEQYQNADPLEISKGLRFLMMRKQKLYLEISQDSIPYYIPGFSGDTPGR